MKQNQYHKLVIISKKSMHNHNYCVWVEWAAARNRDLRSRLFAKTLSCRRPDTSLGSLLVRPRHHHLLRQEVAKVANHLVSDRGRHHHSGEEEVRLLEPPSP